MVVHYLPAAGEREEDPSGVQTHPPGQLAGAQAAFLRGRAGRADGPARLAELLRLREKHPNEERRFSSRAEDSRQSPSQEEAAPFPNLPSCIIYIIAASLCLCHLHSYSPPREDGER